MVNHGVGCVGPVGVSWFRERPDAEQSPDRCSSGAPHPCVRGVRPLHRGNPAEVPAGCRRFLNRYEKLLSPRRAVSGEEEACASPGSYWPVILRSEELTLGDFAVILRASGSVRVDGRVDHVALSSGNALFLRSGEGRSKVFTRSCGAT